MERGELSVNDAIDIANRNNDGEFLAKAFFLKAQIGKKYSFKVENGQFLYANDGVIKINLYHRLGLSAAEASKYTLFIAKILRDSADTNLMRYALPTPEEFWQKGNFMTAFNALGKTTLCGLSCSVGFVPKKDVFLTKPH